MADEWIAPVILVETTVRGKRVKVDPVKWINWEFERGHLDRMLHSLLENVRSVRRSQPPEQQV